MDIYTIFSFGIRSDLESSPPINKSVSSAPYDDAIMKLFIDCSEGGGATRVSDSLDFQLILLIPKAFESSMFLLSFPGLRNFLLSILHSEMGKTSLLLALEWYPKWGGTS